LREVEETAEYGRFLSLLWDAMALLWDVEGVVVVVAGASLRRRASRIALALRRFSSWPGQCESSGCASEMAHTILRTVSGVSWGFAGADEGSGVLDAMVSFSEVRL
jgi:hypothetical protein